MRLIRKKEIKFVKLLLISPYFDQIIHLLYLISLGMLYYKFINIPENFTNYEIGKQISRIYKEEEFRKMNNIEDFKIFMNDTVYNLYDMRKLPLFIPVGAVRLKKYTIIDECFDIIGKCKDLNSCKLKK